MEQEVVVTLKASPQECLDALKAAVAQRFEWRTLARQWNETARFVIEKRVKYDMGRGWSIYATHTIAGNIQATQDGGSTLYYRVGGQRLTPFFQAVMHIGIMLIFVVLLASITFDPRLVDGWIGVLLLVVLVVSVIVYGVVAHRSYHNHLRELHEFMAAFAQRMA